MKTCHRIIATLVLLLGASLSPMSASAAGQDCNHNAFLLDDVQGVYDGVNIEMLVFPCGGAVVKTGDNGNLQWVSAYYGAERNVDGSIMFKFTTFGDSGPIVSYGVKFDQLVITPDIPGRIHLWSVTRAGDTFSMYLDKTSDDPNSV